MNSLLKIMKLETGFRVGKERIVTLHKDLNFEVHGGQFVAILGPNGAGKSTLLRSVLGAHKALNGDVFFGADSLGKLSVKELAKRVAVVLTDKLEESFLIVYEIVATGRYPYTGITGRLSDEDKMAVNDALRQVGMEDLSGRFFNKLSDGEKQKVMIARAIAQQTPLIILDEPVAFIDAPSKVEIMELLLSLSHTHGKGILMATHDLEAAVRFSDKLWLLGNNGEQEQGMPKELLENGTLNRFFDKHDIVLNKKKMIFEKKRINRIKNQKR